MSDHGKPGRIITISNEVVTRPLIQVEPVLATWRSFFVVVDKLTPKEREVFVETMHIIATPTFVVDSAAAAEAIKDAWTR